MTADKLSLSLDAEVCAAVRRSAHKSGADVSAWVADAVRTKLRHEAALALVESWHEEYGPPSPEEMARARVELGLPERTPQR